MSRRDCTIPVDHILKFLAACVIFTKIFEKKGKKKEEKED